jgi:hypothetical protein
MDKIEFETNANGKLFMDTFGTIQFPDEKYYDGNHLQVTLNGMSLGILKVVAVRPFQYNQIRDVLSYLECGKPAHYLAELIRRGNDPNKSLPAATQLYHVVLQYVKRDIDNQRPLLQEWWQSKIQEDKAVRQPAQTP